MKISSQALAEALTTSKGMVGRRLLQCSDLHWYECINFPWPVGRKCFSVGFANQCNSIINGVTASWSHLYNGMVSLKNKAERALVVAAAAATKKFNEAAAAATRTLNAAKAAATRTLNAAAAAATRTLNAAMAAATRTLNAVKADLEKAVKEATKYVEDVGNAFGELGNEIQCAHPSRLPPPASRLLLASRPPRCSDISLRTQRADIAHNVLTW